MKSFDDGIAKPLITMFLMILSIVVIGTAIQIPHMQQEQLLSNIWNVNKVDSDNSRIKQQELFDEVYGPTFFRMEIPYKGDTLSFARKTINEYGYPGHGYSDWDCVPRETQAHKDYINRLRSLDETRKTVYFLSAFDHYVLCTSTEQTESRRKKP
jgi:hypothetical protein